MEENTTTNNTTETNDNLAKAKVELESVLKKYNIALIPVVMHHGDKTLSRIDIIDAPQQVEAASNKEQ